MLLSRAEVGRVVGGGDDADRLVAEALQQRVVHGGPAGEQRDLGLEAEVGVGAHELHRVGAGEAVEHAVDVADLGDEGRVVGRHQRRPQLLDDLAAGVLEHALERRHLLVAEGEVVGDGGDALELQLLGRVVAHHVAALPRGRRGPDDERVGLALRHVLGGGEADQRRGVVAHVVGDGEQLEGGERAEDDVDLVALDHLLRLGLGAGRVAAGVGDQQLHLAAGQRVVLLLQERGDALLHLDAALRQRPGLDREQADLERRALRMHGRHLQRGGAGAGCQHALQDGSALNSHWSHSPWFAV